MKLEGTELTAKFFEAGGREVEPLNGMAWDHRGQLLRSGHPLCNNIPVPDWTRPGHLEDVIGLVRERWPDKHLFVRYDADRRSPEKWTALIELTIRTRGDAAGPASALMLAACRAGGVNVDE